jgi:hypothetical protein
LGMFKGENQGLTSMLLWRVKAADPKAWGNCVFGII